MAVLSHRIARMTDLPALRDLMDRAIDTLQSAYLTPAQVIASRAVMGLDTQLIEDGTYVVVERAGTIVGCGGWSARATLFGGDHSAPQRDPRLIDPATDAARIRAMYTDPAAARQGIGRRVLALCEGAARDAGFGRAVLMATLAGEPLYRACGYTPVERVESPVGDIVVPLVRMTKPL